MPRLLRLDHVALAMPEGGEVDARRFYADALGLREVPKPPNLARRGGAWFGGEGSGLRDLAAVFRARGFEVVADEPLEGRERLCTSDPFGDRVELMGPAAEALAGAHGAGGASAQP